MEALQHITIIGNGKVGRFMQRYLSRYYDVELLSRDNKGEKALYESLAGLPGETDLVLICVSDQAIEEISTAIPQSDTPLAHVSGATPLGILSRNHQKCGIWYPLMSFTDDTDPDFETIPFCVEATDSETLRLLKALTTSLGARAYEVDSQQRKQLHLAAVLAQNFSNHLYQLAYEEMNKARLDFTLLQPLLLQSVKRLGKTPPKGLQTGPAVRHDKATLDAHESMITDPDTLHIYQTLTQSIQKKHDQEL